MEGAITREKAIKGWKRAWKIELIEKSNSQWRDLYNDLAWVDSGFRRNDEKNESDKQLRLRHGQRANQGYWLWPIGTPSTTVTVIPPEAGTHCANRVTTFWQIDEVGL